MNIITTVPTLGHSWSPSCLTATWRKLPVARCARLVGGKWLELREPQGRALISEEALKSGSALVFVCYRWSSRRPFLTNGHAYLPSSTCCHSASPQHPCSATTGLWAYRRCPSPCAGKVCQLCALTCRCPCMGAVPTHHPRRWCNTAGRLGMTAAPSVPSGVACGSPVRKSWKTQVAPHPTHLIAFPHQGSHAGKESVGVFVRPSLAPAGPHLRPGVSPSCTVSLPHQTPS